MISEHEIAELKLQVEELQRQIWILTQGDDWLKNVKTQPLSAGAGMDHGGLAGLGDDDHPQYQTPTEHTSIGDGTPHHTKYLNSEAVAAVAAADDYLKNDASDSTSGTVTAAGFTTTGIAALTQVSIDSTPANDTCSGITMELVAGAALTRGDCCYVGSDNKMEKTDADAEATSRCIAIVEEATIAENATGTFLMWGTFEKEFNFGANIGKRVYLDTATAGGVTLTQPSGEDDCIVIVGIVMGDDLLYFNPSVQAIVEHVAP